MGTIAYLKPYELQSLNDLKQSLNLDFQLIDLRLYGSKARGTADADSDIDVMIELEDGPMSASPLFKAIERDGVRL